MIMIMIMVHIHIVHIRIHINPIHGVMRHKVMMLRMHTSIIPGMPMPIVVMIPPMSHIMSTPVPHVVVIIQMPIVDDRLHIVHGHTPRAALVHAHALRQCGAHAHVLHGRHGVDVVPGLGRLRVWLGIGV